MQPWLDVCCKLWRTSFAPSTYITVDESMVGWSGLGEQELTFLPRKPCDLGMMLKTACCSKVGVMVAAEICEGKDLMKDKPYNKEWGGTTGCVLRLTKPWWGTGRIIIADAWFGSLRCAYQLLTHHLYCIMNVKTCHAGFPKKALRDMCPARNDRAHMELVTHDGLHVFGSCHRDVQPMVLVHTTGSSEEGESRFRRFAAFDKAVGHVVRQTYVLEQPDAHSKYRELFSAVDRFNKLALSTKDSV